MLNKMVVEKYKFGPVRDGNHQDFALVEKDGRWNGNRKVFGAERYFKG